MNRLPKEWSTHIFCADMKAKLGIIILLLICVVLGVALLVRHNKAERGFRQDQDQIATLSNSVKEVSAKLQEQQQVNVAMAENEITLTNAVSNMSNELAKVAANLARTEADAKVAAQAAQAEIARQKTRITELESQRDELTQKLLTLNTNIDTLEKQITSTEQKLAASEGDRDFLLKELKRLQTEKAELERQFNDLAAVRAQVSHLKEELAIARRLDFIRSGLFGGSAKGGAEKLMTPSTPRERNTNFNLNVEIRQGGESRILNSPTNPPPAPVPPR